MLTVNAFAFAEIKSHDNVDLSTGALYVPYAFAALKLAVAPESAVTAPSTSHCVDAGLS